eukprot:COSAG01_NODE_1475_length_10189_cov_9.333399_7_plen_181_part_00
MFDVESEPARPRLVGRWDAPSRVEGQDRRGDVLVVTDITDGVLYVFDAARSVAEGPVGSCNLSVNGALHVRLYCPGGDGSGGESEATGGGGAGRLPMFALVTSGFATCDHFTLPHSFLRSVLGEPSATIGRSPLYFGPHSSWISRRGGGSHAVHMVGGWLVTQVLRCAGSPENVAGRGCH